MKKIKFVFNGDHCLEITGVSNETALTIQKNFENGDKIFTNDLWINLSLVRYVKITDMK